MLKLYPDQTNRAVLRAGADVLVLAWMALWIVIGGLAHRLVESLQSTVDGLQSSGEAIKAVLGPFAHGPLNRLVGNVLSPDLGDRVVALAGRSRAAIDHVALAPAVASAVVPILLLVVQVSKDPAADLRSQHHEALGAEMMRSLGLDPSRLQTWQGERAACPSLKDRVDS